MSCSAQARASRSTARPTRSIVSGATSKTCPRFMQHLVSVTASDRSALPLGRQGSRRYDGGVDRGDRRGSRRRELISWRSLAGTDIANEGSVRFATRRPIAAPRCGSSCATTPPAGSAGALIAKLFGEEPEQQLRDDLRRFKQVMETGEVVRSEGSLAGRRRRRHARAAPGPGAARVRGAIMKANCWMGKKSVEVIDVPDPKILNQRDAIVRITSTAICGSDLHLYNGFMPTMKKGDILGHEFMGEVMEVGRGVKNLKVGDRVVVPFPIACGDCWQCQHEHVVAVRELQPECGARREADGPRGRPAPSATRT